jgi:hypothetical protein
MRQICAKSRQIERHARPFVQGRVVGCDRLFKPFRAALRLPNCRERNAKIVLQRSRSPARRAFGNVLPRLFCVLARASGTRCSKVPDKSPRYSSRYRLRSPDPPACHDRNNAGGSDKSGVIAFRSRATFAPSSSAESAAGPEQMSSVNSFKNSLPAGLNQFSGSRASLSFAEQAGYFHSAEFEIGAARTST